MPSIAVGHALGGWHGAVLGARFLRRAVRPGHRDLDHHRGHAPAARYSALILLLDGTVLVAGGNDCLDGVCVDTGAAELYVPAGVSPPPLPAFPSPPPPVIPTPTPIPTPYPPEAGPVPPNARPLKLTVVNRSDQPATLFVADEDERGTMARLAGNVTPHVVPPGATVQVTLLVPAKGRGWMVDLGEPGSGPWRVGRVDRPVHGGRDPHPRVRSTGLVAGRSDSPSVRLPHLTARWHRARRRLGWWHSRRLTLVHHRCRG